MPKKPKYPENEPPQDLDPEPILNIHRGNPEGYIAFLAKGEPGGHAKNIAAVKVKEVREMLPGILAQYVSYDGYFTVNSYYQAGGLWKKTGFHYPLRKEKNLLELAACYADLDIGRPETIDFEEGRMKADALQREGLIPPYSIMANSGRGMYLFWLLKDDKNPEGLPRAYPATIKRYKQVNKALHKRLYELEPDLKAHDAARILRIPGSIHRKTLRKVHYILQADINRQLMAYTLPELEEYLHLQTPELSLPEPVREKARPQIYTREPKTYRKTQQRGKYPARIAGFKRLNALRSQDLETIEHWRGGFLHAGEKYPDGFTSPGRAFMLNLYAQFLKTAGETRHSVEKAVKTMARNCRPAFPSDPSDPPLAEIINNTFSGKPGKYYGRVYNWKLCAWLGINEYTDPELLNELETILPAGLKDQRLLELPKQSDFSSARRESIRQQIAGAYKLPSLRKMARFLEATGHTNPATGKAWSYEIIRADYKALNAAGIIQENLNKRLYEKGKK